MESLTEKNIKLNFGEINYVDYGKGDVIIFLHNGGGFWYSWVKQLEYFSKTNRVIAIDFPGCGKSDEYNSPLTLSSMTEVFIEFVEKLKLKDVVLIGNCIGASIALNYGNKYSLNVKKLLLFNICPGKLMLSKKSLHFLFPTFDRSKIIRGVGKKSLDFLFRHTSVKKRFPSILFHPNFSKKDVIYQSYVNKLKTKKQFNSRTDLWLSIHTYTLDYYHDTSINTKCLLVWGDSNQATSLEEHGYLHEDKLKPDSFHVVPKSGHLCMYEQPVVVNELIKEYLKIE